MTDRTKVDDLFIDPHDSLMERSMEYYNKQESSKSGNNNEALLEKTYLEQAQILQMQKVNYEDRLINSNHSKLINIEQVVVNNNCFRDSYLRDQLLPLVDEGKKLQTFEQFLQNVELVNFNLRSSDSLDNLMINVEHVNKNKYYEFSGNNSIFKDLNVVPVVNMVPSKHFFVKTGTSFGNDQNINGYTTVQLKNLFKGGESLSFDSSLGTKIRNSYILNYNSPIWNNNQLRYDGLLYMNHKKNDFASNDEYLKGMSNKIVKIGLFGNRKIMQELSFENVLRNCQINNVNGSRASDYVLLECYDDFKSSIIYNFKYDTLNDKVLPKTGQLFKIQMELAMKNNPLVPKFMQNLQTSNFLKMAVNWKLAADINEKLLLNCSLNAGMIQELDKGQRTCHMMDKFQLGGPADVRAFEMHGLGPVMCGNRIGGDIFYNLSLSAFTPVPMLSLDALKLHGFINAGKLINSSSKQGWLFKNGLFSEPSVGIGSGIVLNYAGSARFELNFTLPVLAHSTDSIRKGFQYGIGMSFS